MHDAAAAEAFGLGAGDVVVSIHCGSRGLRPPDRHRVPARDARRGPEARHRPARPRARLRPGPLEGGRALPRRDARRHQRGPRQPPGPHPPHARGVRPRAPAVGPDRCSTTSRTTPARWRRTRWTAKPRELYVHRKGATRALGPGHPGLPDRLRAVGQPVLIGGTMGTSSWVLAGTETRHAGELRLGLPRRGPEHEPPPGRSSSGTASRWSRSWRAAAS